MIECIAGETLSISLEGIKPVDGTLHFYSNRSVVTLVEKGVLVGKKNANYFNRLKATGEEIKMLNVKKYDEGRYELIDQKGRTVSNSMMQLRGKNHISPNVVKMP